MSKNAIIQLYLRLDMENYQLFLICFFSSIILVLFIVFFAAKFKINIKKLDSKFVFLILYLLGFGLYLYGILLETSNLNTFPRILYAIASTFSNSLKMFAFSLETGSVAIALESTWYMLSYIILHILAFCFSQFFIIRVFGKSIINALRLMTFHFHDRLILIGKPKLVMFLLDNIGEKQSFKVLVLCCQLWSEEERKKLLEYNVLTMKCDKIDEEVLEKAKVRNRKDKMRVSLISLFEDEQKTLDLAATIRKFIEEQKETEIANFKAFLNFERMDYADLIDKNSSLTKKDGRINFFSRADLIAKKFINDYTILDLVDDYQLDSKRALLSSKLDLSYFFYGFGETGKQLLKKTFSNNALLDDKYRAYIIDLDAKEREREFHHHYPGLDEEIGKKYGEFHFSKNTNVLTDDFYKYLHNNISKNNVFFITLGNDLNNYKTALELSRIVENIILDTKREIKAKIFVNIRFQTAYYQVLKQASSENIEIILFGDLKEIYSYDRIIAARDDLWGRRIDRAYRILKEKNFEISKEIDNINWNNKTTQFKKESSKMAGLNIRTKLQLLGLDLVSKEEYLRTNAYEALTTTSLFDSHYNLNEFKFSSTLPEYKEEKKYYDLSGSNQDYEKLRNIYQDYQHPATNLARQEHLRWNCFSLINGWRSLSFKEHDDYSFDENYSIRSQNPALLRHMNLIEWEELVEYNNYVSEKVIKKAKITTEEEKNLVYYSNDVLKYDYFTLFGLAAILEGTDYYICRKKLKGEPNE